MRENYFIVNGKKYYTGTVFLIQNGIEQKEATFVCYDLERKEYVYKIKHGTYFANDDYFKKMFIRVTDKINANIHMPVTKRLPDSQITGLPLGWIWYIFLMGIVTIFKGQFGLWILISIIFFNWKIKKEGTYIEW